MSIMAVVTKLAKRQSNYRISDYVRKARKNYNMIVTSKQVRFCLNRLNRHDRINVGYKGQLVITNGFML